MDTTSQRSFATLVEALRGVLHQVAEPITVLRTILEQAAAQTGADRGASRGNGCGERCSPPPTVPTALKPRAPFVPIFTVPA